VGTILPTWRDEKKGKELLNVKANTKKTISSIAALLIIAMILSTSVNQAAVASSNSSLLMVLPQRPRIRPSGPYTPLQGGIMQEIENLTKYGQPHPHATFEYSETSSPDGVYSNGTGITTLQYDNPQQAGLTMWPLLLVANATGTYNETQKVIDAYPSVYGPGGAYTYGEEPRNYTITELFNITNPEPIEAPAMALAPRGLTSTSISVMSFPDSTTTQDILMGFTLAVPKIDWTIGTKVSVWGFVIFEARAGFYMDIGFGLRLPVRVSMSHPDLMTVSHSYTLSTSVAGVDWGPTDYSNAGLPSDAVYDGNEFVFRFKFFLGVKLTVMDVDLIDWYIQSDMDESENFATPLGTGAQIPIPTLTIPPDVTGLELSEYGASIGIGLSLEPSLVPDYIKADWSASGAASGGGSIEYHQPNTPYDFGPVNTPSTTTTDYTLISLYNFRYVFSLAAITVDADIELGGLLAFVPNIPYFDLYTFDLSDYSLDMSFGVHDGTPGTVDASIFVQNFGVGLSVSPGTLDVEPGHWGDYTVTVTNKGNVPDTFYGFSVLGLPPNWEYTMSKSEVGPLAPGGSGTFDLHIKPWRNYVTSLGDYPFTVVGASEGATLAGLVRTGSGSAIVHVLPFFEVGVSIKPKSYTLKPGNAESYAINVTNLGNVVDSFSLAPQYTDFGTKYRAVPTVIQTSWTTITKTSIGPLAPGAYDIATLTISVPADWAGMENTTYEFNATATSLGDTHVPKANKTDSANLIVQATRASMTRYIDMELQSLINTVGTSTVRGMFKDSLVRLLTYAVWLKETKPPDINLGACRGIVQTFISSVANLKLYGMIPKATADSWIASAQTIVNDLTTALNTPP
jgi:hypothetical protein